MSIDPIRPLAHFTADRDVCAAYAADASGLSRPPEAVVRPECEEEVAELMRRCHEYGIPVTPQGLRSSTTGASVPQRGIVLSLERMASLVRIDPGERTAVAQSGILTSEFKRQVQEAGLFYPVDPTSEEECTLGGTVACNASGSRTYRYGPTRPYVRRLRVVLAGGTVEEVRRIGANKNSSGYFGLQNPVDLWIGSEGTLGIITEIEVDLLPPPPGYFAALAFFPDWRSAVGFVLTADARRHAGVLNPRCLELFDHGSLELIRPRAASLHLPREAGAAVFFEEESHPGDAPTALERWYEVIEETGGLADDTMVAQTTVEQRELRLLRHALPTEMNERGARAVQNGGRKVSTDWAVPLDRFPQMMEESYRIAGELFGGFHLAYGHAGNGHPHFNLLAEDPAALNRATEAARRMSRRAMELGGTLSAEHGVGKLKAALYRELYPRWLYESMWAVKRTLDPKGILSPGNLFTESSG